MINKFKWFILSLILIVNLQIYAYKYASHIPLIKSPKGVITHNDSDQRHEILNKKFNLTDNNSTDNKRHDKLDNNSKNDVREQLQALTTTTTEKEEEEEITDYPNPFGFGAIEPEVEEDWSSECILARSEFYLSWWVHENGSLRVTSSLRLNGSGVLDLSLNFSSEDTIFTHVLNFTTDNPSEVTIIMQFYHISKLVPTLP